MKTTLIKNVQAIIKEKWEENKLLILVDVQEIIDVSEFELIDISFGVRQAENSLSGYDYFTLRFKVKTEVVEVDYLLDKEEEEEEKVKVSDKLRLHNLYAIYEEEENSINILSLHQMHPKYDIHYGLLNTLNELKVKKILDSFENELIQFGNEHKEKKDAEFFNKNKVYLEGIKSIKNTMYYHVSLVLDSGMPLVVSKYYVENWINKKKGNDKK